MSAPRITPAASRPSRPPRRAGTSALARRFPMLVLGVCCLLAGLWGGLLLLGLHVPALHGATAGEHGPLMALGFLGTVISLERAVALRRLWGYAAPAAAGAGGVVLLLGLPEAAGWTLLCLAAVVFVLMYAVLLTIAPAPHLVVMTAGAVCWYLASVLWFGGFEITRLVPWLAGFLVLTILGERLELARVALLTPASIRAFVAGAGAFAVGIALTTASGPAATAGVQLAGAGLLALAVWGAAYDVARRTVRIAGVTRFMACCLLAGYAWLATGGAIWLVAGDLGRSQATYDAALHAVFLGFVMSMVFAHAPVIVPAVLGVRLPYRHWFYGHVVLLHAALLLRVVGGDLLGSRLAWQVGGAGTELAIVAFLAASVLAAARAPRRRMRVA